MQIFGICCIIVTIKTSSLYILLPSVLRNHKILEFTGIFFNVFQISKFRTNDSFTNKIVPILKPVANNHYINY